MVPELSKLDDGEIELMLKAPILVCILIAGADGTIDKKEIKEGIAVASKEKKSKSLLANYFKEVSTDFEDKLLILTQTYPYIPSERSALIVQELAGLNNLFGKLDKDFAVAFYDMIRELALKIASSSGGLLGMRKVGSEEAEFVELSMINNPA